MFLSPKIFKDKSTKVGAASINVGWKPKVFIISLFQKSYVPNGL